MMIRCYGQMFRAGAIAALALGLIACAAIEPRPALPVDMALPIGNDSPIDRATAALEAQHPGQSAFRLVTEGEEAFVVRAQTARYAARSIDVQTYIWHPDLTGLYLTHALLEAADRGVKVRILLDDLDGRSKNNGLAALAAHRNVEVRLFNPFASRQGTFGFLGESLSSFDRINRRMHNKTWIADNRIAIAGGRNIGNEYFSASDEVNFVDLDFAMVGPVVRDASASFDKYWNAASAYPIETLDPERVTTTALDELRNRLTAFAREAQNSHYAKALAASDSIQQLVKNAWPMQWSGNYQFVSDDPLKVGMQQYDAQRTHVADALKPMLAATATHAVIISPYFVPGEKATANLAKLAQSGKAVRILTNSLSANDVAAVHGGYSRYREPLLEGGVQLWELKPTHGSARSSLFGSSGASLHTKALATDGRMLFVGSYNLDPRSTWLNCEQGVLVESAELAHQFEAIFAAQTTGQRAWRVTLEHGDMQWRDGSETFDSDPKASFGRRFQAWFARVFDIEAQL